MAKYESTRGETDGSDRLTGGYGGDPEADEPQGSTDPDDLGTDVPEESGLTAGGTGTSIPTGMSRGNTRSLDEVGAAYSDVDSYTGEPLTDEA